MRYDGSATKRSTVEVRNNPLASAKPAGLKEKSESLLTSAATSNVSWPKLTSGAPDFDQMTAAQRVAYHDWRLKRTFG